MNEEQKRKEMAAAAAAATHYGSEQPNFVTANHFPPSSGASERSSDWMSTAERASKARRAEQANEWAVQANEQTDERVAQYLRLDSW